MNITKKKMENLENAIYNSGYGQEYGKIGPELDKLIEMNNFGVLDKSDVNFVKLKRDIVILINKIIVGAESEEEYLKKTFTKDTEKY